MKVLHVMSEFPYPPDSGIRADVWNRLRAMNRLGYSIHALVIKQKATPEAQHVAEMRCLVARLQWVERRPLQRCVAGIIPAQVKCNHALAKLPLSEPYDLTLMESENVFPICDNPRLRTKRRVLRVHNNESTYMWNLAKAEESFLREQVWRLEALRFLSFSKYAYCRSDALWFISQSECQAFIAKHPAAAAKAVWLPPAISLGSKAKPRTTNSRRVLFVASLSTPLNREALRWYLKEVHVRLTPDPQYQLVVAGSTQGRAAALLFAEEIRREARCTVQLDVEDLTPLYQDCALFINPMRRGTGVKLKNLHAMARGIPVVSTSVGNEGSGLYDQEHLLIADKPEDFAAAIMRLLNNDRLRAEIAGRAYAKLIALYNCEANIHRLVTSLAPETSERSSDQAIFLSA